MDRNVPDADPSRPSTPTPTPWGNDGACLFDKSVFSGCGPADFWWAADVDYPVPAPADWVVVIEATTEAEEGGLSALEALLEELAQWHPCALYHQDLYAVQLHVAAAAAPDALRHAVAYHDRAARTVGLRGARLVRAEVVTRAEHDNDCAGRPGGGRSGPAGADATFVADIVHQATRALLHAATVAEVTDVVTDFVVLAGGAIHLGPRPGAIAAEETTVTEISLGPGRQRHAVADAMSVAGLLFEHSLPTLVDDARRRADALASIL